MGSSLTGTSAALIVAEARKRGSRSGGFLKIDLFPTLLPRILRLPPAQGPPGFVKNPSGGYGVEERCGLDNIDNLVALVVWGISALICLAVGTGIPAILVYTYFRRRKALNLAGGAVLASRFAGEELLLSAPAAEFLGREEQEVLAGQGNLGVSRAAVFYSSYLNGVVLNIPMASLRSVELVDHFRGQSRLGRKLLKLGFEAFGKADSAAFAVEDPGQWKRVIEGLLRE